MVTLASTDLDEIKAGLILAMVYLRPDLAIARIHDTDPGGIHGPQVNHLLAYLPEHVSLAGASKDDSVTFNQKLAKAQALLLGLAGFAVHAA